MLRIRTAAGRGLLAILLASCFVLTSTSPSWADKDCSGAHHGGDSGSIDGSCDHNGDGGNQGNGGGGSPSYPYQWLMTYGDDYGAYFCTMTSYVADKSLAEAKTQATAWTRLYYLYVENLTDKEPCPNLDPPADIPTSVTDAVNLSVRESHHLPVPTLTATPTHALAGLPVYLQIGGSPMDDFDLLTQVNGRTIHIHVSSQYVVDWGDSQKVTTTSQGGSYPTGDLTHTYDQAGSFTLGVQQQWVATWHADDGTSGTINGLLTQATAPPLTVDQAEAVGSQ